MSESKTIERIKEQITIPEYAQSHLKFTVTRAGSSVSFKEHDSVRVFDEGRAYKRWSTGTGGSIIDFVMEFEGLSLSEAIKHLSTMLNVPEREDEANPPPRTDTKPEPFMLPEAYGSNKRLFAYLNKTRGISQTVIERLIKDKLIYEESSKYHNIVFVGRRGGEPVRAMINTSQSKYRFKQDMGDNSYPFSFGTSNTVIVYESPIDAMSHASIQLDDEIDWSSVRRIAIGGAEKLKCITNYLDDHSNIDEVILSFDNDDKGREASAKAIQLVKEYADRAGRTIKTSELISTEKDWNDDLMKLNTATATENNKTDIGRVNEGYVITESVTVGANELVMGHNPKSDMFVTWRCDGGDYYYWGHYFPTLLEAQKDLYERAIEQIDRLQSFNEKEEDKPPDAQRMMDDFDRRNSGTAIPEMREPAPEDEIEV